MIGSSREPSSARRVRSPWRRRRSAGRRRRSARRTSRCAGSRSPRDRPRRCGTRTRRRRRSRDARALEAVVDELRDVLVVLDDEHAGTAATTVLGSRWRIFSIIAASWSRAGPGANSMPARPRRPRPRHRRRARPPHGALDRDRLEQAGEREHELDLGADRQLAVGRDERAARRQVLGVVTDQVVGALRTRRTSVTGSRSLFALSSRSSRHADRLVPRTACRSRYGSCHAPGTLTVKRRTVPTVLSTARSPPWSFTICWVSARPRPLPPSFVEKNGSNRRRQHLGAMPAPSSSTPISTYRSPRAGRQRHRAAALGGHRLGRVAHEVDAGTGGSARRRPARSERRRRDRPRA